RDFFIVDSPFRNHNWKILLLNPVIFWGDYRVIRTPGLFVVFPPLKGNIFKVVGFLSTLFFFANLAGILVMMWIDYPGHTTSSNLGSLPESVYR
ncbi:MAG: hypothetical protein KZQ78_02280, partial [Candidatus Thiodiazotropha sp. (ex Ustalcina ferruginea)]|nr:hypothetical protein [Candidatus Thiodiazotropha sp. (ex Ustalcina ferruginea)]